MGEAIVRHSLRPSMSERADEQHDSAQAAREDESPWLLCGLI